MNTSWRLSTAALAAGHMMIAGAHAAPPAGSGMVAPRADVVRIQAVNSPEAPADRMARLWQHRSILENALQPAARAALAEPPAPPAPRPLRPPEAMIATAPQDQPNMQEPVGEGHGQLSCEDAARIVSDFGFSDIGSQECAGDLYTFSAMRDGTAYEIGISAATGEVAEVSRQ